MLTPIVRVGAAILGVVMVLGGLGVTAVGGVAGLWSTLFGAVILILLAVERNRYRSEAAEHAFEPVGRGGGEPSGALEPRFRATPETFVDPTTNRRMRVYADATTGDRRYMAED
jgi:hypothetical protein